MDRLVQSRYAEVGFQRIRYPPSQHLPSIPVYYGDQIEEALSHRQIGDVGTPDLVGPFDPQATQQVRVDLVPLRGLAGVGLLVIGSEEGQKTVRWTVSRRTRMSRISRRMRFSFTLWPFSGLRGPTGATVPATAQVPGHLTDAVERGFQELPVDQP